MTYFEEKIKEDLHKYLLMEGEIDQHLPDAPDIEERWQGIAEAYLPDGMREYRNYPNVSLGWMMYIGMAVAKLWDENWEQYSKEKDLYAMLRKPRGYDLMDEYIRQEILGLQGKDYDRLEQLVGECAARTNSQILHSPIQPGTRPAFDAYVGCLHQLYLMGAAVQLKRMGYRMEKL